MLPAALTAERVRLPDGTSATRYPWNGEEVLVRDDALTIIRVIEVLTDEGKSDDQRRDEFLALFFVDWADAWCACDYDAAEFVRMRRPFFGLVVQAAEISPVSRFSTMNMRHAP